MYVYLKPVDANQLNDLRLGVVIVGCAQRYSNWNVRVYMNQNEWRVQEKIPFGDGKGNIQYNFYRYKAYDPKDVAAFLKNNPLGRQINFDL